MSMSTLAILAFTTGTFLALGLGSVGYDLFLRYPTLVRRRMAELTDDDSDANVSKQLFPGLAISRRGVWSGVSDRTGTIRLWIEQAGLDFSLEQLAAASALLAALALALGYFLDFPFWLTLPAVVLGGALPFLYVRSKRAARQKQLLHQLPDAFSSVARAVKSGQTVQSAMQLIADDFAPPVCKVFSRCCDQQNLGIRQEVALHDLGSRSGVLELQIFALALIVQSRSGGDLIELLENLAFLIRTRIKMQNRIRAMTGEGRAQAFVLIILCSSVFVGLYFFMPDYVGALLKRPKLLLATICAQLVGLVWIRRIISVEL